MRTQLVPRLALLTALVAFTTGVAVADESPAPVVPTEDVEAPAPLGSRLAAGALAASAEIGMVSGAPEADDRPAVGREFSNVDLVVLAESAEVAPGGTLRLGAFFDLDENWHVYDANNPGDIGLPTTVTLTLPDGWTQQRWRSPGPEVYREKSGDTSYVHHESYALVTELEVPDDAPVGSVVLQAEYDFQFCYDRCIRKFGELKLPLDIVADASGAELHGDAFDAVEPRLAVLDHDGVTAAFSHSHVTPEQAAILVVDVQLESAFDRDGDAERPMILFDDIEGLDVEALEVLDVAEGHVRAVARVSVAEDAGDELEAQGTATLGATIQVRADGEDDYTTLRIEPALALAAAGSTSDALDHPLLANIDVEAYLGLEGDAATAPTPPPVEQLPLWQALLFAFLGGIILNIMPCVLPVLSLKALALVEEATESQRKVQSFVAMYVLGVLASFWVLAGVVISIKLSGELVGWGFQFQEPGYVLVMSGVIFAFALSLFGVFEIPGLTMNSGESGGLKGSFMHGVLTTALSTPCSAPLLGSALTFALAQSPMMIVITFSLIGVGLAAPVSVLTLVPAARRFIPRPGPWMDTFKHIIAFLLVGTVIWLVGVLGAQISADSMLSVYILFGLIAFAGWVLGRWTGPLAPTNRKIIALSVALLAVVVGARQVSLDVPPLDPNADLSTELIEWKAFQGEESLALAASGKTLFIDFTADWCATCKTMEATAIETEAVSQLIRENGVVPLKADLTRKNPELSKWVEYYGRSAIPLFVVIPAGKPDEPNILPEAITESMLLDALRKAGPSKDEVKETQRSGAAKRSSRGG